MKVNFTKKELKLLKNSICGSKIYGTKTQPIKLISYLRRGNELSREELLSLIRYTDTMSENMYDQKNVLGSIEMSDLNKKLNRIFDENENR